MFPQILHIYGPISINSYGTMIAIGFLLFTYLTYNHPIRKKLIDGQNFFDALFLGLFSGIIGGRILFILENYKSFSNNWVEVFYPWIGGFSVQGTIIAVLITLTIYLKAKKVPLLPFMDLIAIYAPLLQSISRIGCFLAGCCYGKQCCNDFIFSVSYANPQCLAPLNEYLHPTQLYSCIASFLIFLILLLFISKKTRKPGQVVFSYLFLEGAARFIVDFWRGDRTLIGSFISFSQFFAISLSVFAIFAFLYITFRKKNK